MNSYVAEFPAISDTYVVFSGIASTTSTDIGVEGGGGREPQSDKQILFQN